MDRSARDRGDLGRIRQLRRLSRLQRILSDVHVAWEKRWASVAHRICVLSVGLPGRRHAGRPAVLFAHLHDHYRGRTYAYFRIAGQRRDLRTGRPRAWILGPSEGVGAEQYYANLEGF